MKHDGYPSNIHTPTHHYTTVSLHDTFVVLHHSKGYTLNTTISSSTTIQKFDPATPCAILGNGVAPAGCLMRSNPLLLMLLTGLIRHFRLPMSFYILRLTCPIFRLSCLLLPRFRGRLDGSDGSREIPIQSLQKILHKLWQEHQ